MRACTSIHLTTADQSGMRNASCLCNGNEENGRVKGEKDAYRLADLLYQKEGREKVEQKAGAYQSGSARRQRGKIWEKRKSYIQ